MIILGPKTAILGPRFCRILVLGPHFWWSGGGGGAGPRGPPLDPPLDLHDFRMKLKSTLAGQIGKSNNKYMKDVTDTVNDVCTDCCCVMGYNYVRAVGYCMYKTLLLRPCSACPVQIRAHYHIDVYTDINNIFQYELYFHARHDYIF